MLGINLAGLYINPTFSEWYFSVLLVDVVKEQDEETGQLYSDQCSLFGIGKRHDGTWFLDFLFYRIFPVSERD
jgi:hypothetical protein